MYLEEDAEAEEEEEAEEEVETKKGKKRGRKWFHCVRMMYECVFQCGFISEYFISIMRVSNPCIYTRVQGSLMQENTMTMIL